MNINEKALESEQAVCGAAMLDGSWLIECDLTPDDFLNEKNRIVFGAIWAVHSRNEPVDIITVNQELESQGFNNWAAYLSELMRGTPSAANAPAYANALKSHAQRAKAAQIYADAIQELGGKDHSIDSVISKLMSLNTTQKNYDKSTNVMMSETIKSLEDRHSGKIKTLSTGISLLDQYLGGIHDSDLIVLAARPAMGKTAVMLNMALSANDRVGLISSEQGAHQLGERVIAIQGSVSIERMRRNKFTQQDWDAVGKVGAQIISKNNFFVNDHPSPDISLIQQQARKWKHQHGIKALFVDYIQRIRSTDQKKPKHEQVGEVVRGLKSLARELDIPVIALAQVNRAVEARPDKRPSMGDISDSSEIEKEADQVICLYRDEVYNENTLDKGIIEFLVRKNRHGSTNYVRAVWFGECMQVKNLAREGAA